jgi:2-methylisocitrate lyase-like PEP mutase family enzyme
MGKLQEMFTQPLRARSGSGLGFIGKNKPSSKPRAAALVVEFAVPDAAIAEAAIKAGADGLLFAWNGQNAALDGIKKAIEAARSGEEKIVCGLDITGGWESLTRETFEHVKELEINYVILPLNAPARLLALQVKDLELIVTVPMRTGDMYPIFIRNLTAFDGLASVRLDFGIQHDIGDLSIEDILSFRAVREAVRFPSMLNIDSSISEADAYTLLTLGVQAVIITANKTSDATKQDVQQVHDLLETVYHEEKDSKESFGLTPSR